jgi:hypothetical protein
LIKRTAIQEILSQSRWSLQTNLLQYMFL